MFRLDNTNGFSDSDIDLMNEAHAVLVNRMSANIYDNDYLAQIAKNAADIITNNWQSSGNTVESLISGA